MKIGRQKKEGGPRGGCSGASTAAEEARVHSESNHRQANRPSTWVEHGRVMPSGKALFKSAGFWKLVFCVSCSCCLPTL